MNNFENIMWFGHASFLLTDKNGKKIYFVDPFDLENRAKEKADIVFITHAHFDHFSPNDLLEISYDKTIIAAPPDILSQININKEKKFKVLPNQNYNIDGFEFKTIPAYNIKKERLEKHPRKNNWVGYIFYLNGKKIYHSGDTDFTPEMAKLKNENLDIAIIPIGGTFVMDADEAAKAANTICAKITIPMHYKRILEEASQEAEKKFVSQVTNSKVVILKELQ